MPSTIPPSVSTARPPRGTPPGRLIRKLRAGERGALAAHFLRLPEYDRAMRFMSTVNDAHIQRYALRSDAAPRLVLGYFADGVLRAAGELIFTGQPVWRGACEVALSVEPGWQHAGIGSELLRRLVLLARNRGASPLVIHFLRENRRMHGLARKFGMHLTFNGGEVTGSLLPTWPTYLTVLGEWAQDGHAAFAHLASRHQASVLERH